jgi:hypothetical protein
MQRLLDKWGLWVAFFVVGGIIAYGLIAGAMKNYDEPAKGPHKIQPAKPQ